MDSDVSRILNAATGGALVGLAIGILFGVVEFFQWLKIKLARNGQVGDDVNPPKSALVFLVCSVACLSPANAFGQGVALDVGGVTIDFSPIPGWCVYPDPTLRAVLQQYQQTDQTNVAHIFFGDCGQVEANTRHGTRIRDFGYLATPREFLSVEIGNRRGFIDEMAEALRTHDPNPAVMSIRDRLNNAEFDIQVGETRLLGRIGQDENAVYSGLLARLRIGSEKFNQVGVYGLTAIKNRIVTCYIYSDHKDESTVKAALSRAQSQIAQLVNSNP